MGRQRVGAGYESSHQHVDHATLLWCERGQVIVRRHGDDHVLEEGECVFFMPQTRHFFYTEAKATINTMSIDGDQVVELLRSLDLDGDTRVFPAALEKEWRKLRESLKEPGARPELLASSALYHFLLRLAHARVLTGAKPSRADEAQMGKIRECLLDHLELTDFGIEKVAEKLGGDAEGFEEIVERVTGSSAKEYVLQLRLQKAMALMSDAGMDLSEVVRATGFTDPAQFSKIFQKQLGLSLQEYRQRLSR